MFAEAIEEILKDHCTPDVVRAAEAGVNPSALWSAIADAGFLELARPEEDGGAGLSLAELFPIFTMLGRYAAPVPLAQTIAARAMLAGQAAMPSGMLTFAAACRRSDSGILCPLTPFGMIAEHVLVNDQDTLLLLDCSDTRRTSTGVRGSLCATLEWENGAELVAIPVPGARLQAYGAALHAALLCGAMQRTFELTLQYANDRTQFGKSIGKFQAIQHQVSAMAEHVAAASIAAEAAFHSDDRMPALIASAIAKSRTSEATVLVASIAHAVHGAIGITEEYDLQLFTRRLHEWRMAHGSEEYWNQVIGRSILESQAPTVTDFVRSVWPVSH